MTQDAAFDAVYFDGASSARRRVRVRREGDLLRICGDGVDASVALREVEVEYPVAGTRHLLRLPVDAQLQTENEAAVRAIFPPRAGSGDWARRLESRWGWALGAVLFIGLVGAWSVLYGLPLGARIAADALPDAAGRELGAQTMQFLDGTFCSTSVIAEPRQREEREALARIASGSPQAGKVRLEFRSCPGIGANALALPDGAVVVTDDLVRLSGKREQLAAVMAHEVGHVVHKHPMRMAIQAAGLAALISTLASDAVSITGLAVALPTLLLETGYSRGFEEEADDFAFARMKGLGISPAHFADILERLEESHGMRSDRSRKSSAQEAGDYFSTHPATASRAQRARDAAR